MDLDNVAIAAEIGKLADLLEFSGANSFKIRAYRNGARVVKDFPDSFATMVHNDPSKITSIQGIGKGVAEKITQLIELDNISEIDELLEVIPVSVLDLLRIPGMGPKKAAALYQILNIQTLDQLQAACEDGQVQELKGFAAKTEQSILDGIAIAAAANSRIRWAAADKLAETLLEHLRACPAVERIELAGSYRRGRETVGDLDLLVISTKPADVMDCFAEFPEWEQTLVRGDTKMSIRVLNSFQVDLRVVPQESFGAAWQYFTGSKDHNVAVRGHAKQLGMKVNEYGVFKVDGDEEVLVAGATEQEVYEVLGLPHFAAEMREAREEFQWAEQGALPELIELSQIQGDLHMHTTATDGKATLAEMVAAARERGLQYIAITDHSQRVSVARGLTAERVVQQWAEIDRFNETIDDDFRVLKGIECDILEAGGMDLPDEVLALADWVIASVHFGQKQSREQITDRIVGALENPYVKIIAHPTGRLINRREAYQVDMDAVFQAAQDNRKMLELNANPARLDLHDVHCAAARKREIPLVISSDAHSVAGLDVMQYGIVQARRGGLTADNVANTQPWEKIQEWFTSSSHLG
ncbi:MAG: DNA polymerase/3'-5' exonuclease PolX [Planctomycetaceae bacterium]|jgi:DNA polymerase (family X)|nr:DNA polymerase/3'-5' exonuclease PolX [Planctomycetaceae bacterium]